MEMSGEVAIAQVEPDRLAEARDLVESLEGLSGQAPALALVDDAAQGVADRVEVGRYVEAPDLGVVAGVDDDGEIARIDEAHEPAEQLGGAGAARERGDVHGNAESAR
jgi:hypothetical protein